MLSAFMPFLKYVFFISFGILISASVLSMIAIYFWKESEAKKIAVISENKKPDKSYGKRIFWLWVAIKIFLFMFLISGTILYLNKAF